MVHWSGVALCARMTTSSVEAITGGSSSFTPAQQHLDERPDRTSPVRDPLFGRKRRFRERHAELGREEQRVVAEPAVAAGRRESGFGYDPLFFSTELGMTFAEAPLPAKQRVSHRGRAIRALIEVLLRRSK